MFDKDMKYEMSKMQVPAQLQSHLSWVLQPEPLAHIFCLEAQGGSGEDPVKIHLPYIFAASGNLFVQQYPLKCRD